MTIKVLVPTIGESVTEAEIAHWLVEDGQFIEKDSEIAEIDSEKATITISADASGTIKIIVPAGQSVKIGAVIAEIDTHNTEQSGSEVKQQKPLKESTVSSETISFVPESKPSGNMPSDIKMTPLAKQIIKEENLEIKAVSESSGLKKISKNEVLNYVKAQQLRKSTRVKMSMLRRKLSERLVAVKNQTAMLTTFNEADMSAIISLRKKHQDAFVSKHGVKLGFMSFFIKAVTMALKEFPEVNASIDDDHIIYYNYVDISVAVSTDKGLMVPVIRNTELLTLADIEKELLKLSEKARTNKISIDEMTGGTFTITNGGVFGSMLSTPILNPPQSAILGMHNIQERVVVVNGKIEVRPMMYLALSYDHRIIDGKESVGFMVFIKKLLESPLDMISTGEKEDVYLLNI
ncbi:MAG: dihydrolipoyllysine-residue succinyltransferase [Bacteroidales bacterium]|nr:dihydrolipoyllysine-residue succinyltransferase [Bacteroidales bacterium]